MLDDIREATTAAGPVEIPHESEVTLTPVPVTGVVTLAGRVPVSEEAADFGTYRTITLAGTEEKQPILGYDARRVRAWIIVSGTGPVWIGSEAQCAAVKLGNTSGGGGRLVSGNQIMVGHKKDVWLVPDGTNPAVVVVIQERMQT
jgi:hypothetical protein